MIVSLSYEYFINELVSYCLSIGYKKFEHMNSFTETKFIDLRLENEKSYQTYFRFALPKLGKATIRYYDRTQDFYEMIYYRKYEELYFHDLNFLKRFADLKKKEYKETTIELKKQEIANDFK